MVPAMGSVDEFYATPLGRMVARLLGERIGLIWPTLAGQSLLGLGYAVPYLPPWAGRAQCCVAMMPPQFDPIRWPSVGPNMVCSASEEALPFADLSFDRVLVVHGLEGAERARRLLREVWRVLKDDGRLLVVAPNRRGMWAHSEANPFGQGQPYSASQVGRLLADSFFKVERREAALFVPPITWRPLQRSAGVLEATARALLPPWVAGLTIAEAVKDIYAAVPVGKTQRRRVLAQVS